MPFQPGANDRLIIEDVEYVFAEHPLAAGMPFGQEGRAAVVYQLLSAQGKSALKVFKPRFRRPSLVSLSERIAPFAQLQGLRVCLRRVLTARRHGELLRQHPDLTYAVLMPWVEGPTWAEVLLDTQPLAPEQSLLLATTFAEILAGMEEQGLAHCDLSGPNVIIPALAEGDTGGGFQAVELVDVEQMYGLGLEKPEVLLSGSQGYAARSGEHGEFWGSKADRFAGAMLLGEMLGWCDAAVTRQSWGETYFDPAEIQDEGSKNYQLLVGVLRERWGDGVADLFVTAWRSDTVLDCPTFGEWLVKLPRSASTRTVEAAAPSAGIAPGNVAALLEIARLMEQEGNLAGALEAYRQVQQAAPAGSSLSGELALIVGRLEAQVPGSTQDSPAVAVIPPEPSEQPASELDPIFNFGMAAYARGEWAGAREMLSAVVRQQPGYARNGQKAAALLEEVEARIMEQREAAAAAPLIEPMDAPAPARGHPVAEFTPERGDLAARDEDGHVSEAAQSAPATQPTIRPLKRNDSRPLLVGGILGVLVLALLLGGFFLAQGRPTATPQPDSSQGAIVEGSGDEVAEAEPTTPEDQTDESGSGDESGEGSDSSEETATPEPEDANTGEATDPTEETDTSEEAVEETPVPQDTSAPEETPTPEETETSEEAAIWRPEPGLILQIQLRGDVDLSIEADVYAIDLLGEADDPARERVAQHVADLKAQDRRAVCYINAGAWEDWRPDRDDFPEEVLGNIHYGTPDMRWLDIRNIEVLGPIMQKRLDLCAALGFDGVAPDSIDGYEADTGFPITDVNQYDYNTWLAAEAHARGLSIGLINNLGQVEVFLDHFDWAVAEECYPQTWCEPLALFVEAGKAAWDVEYTDTDLDYEQVCAANQELDIFTLFKDRELDSGVEYCP